MELDTPEGPGRVLLSPAATPLAVLALGHGAGGGVDAPDLVTLARRLPAVGVSVLRVEQPWRTAGRKIAVAPPRLDRAWRSLLEQIRADAGAALPWLVGGRSAGARVACRTAEALGAVGVVCLAFPLHPPGRPGSSRAGELLAAGVPRLVLQGSRDPFGGPNEVEATLEPVAANGGGQAEVSVIGLPGADHSLRVPKSSSASRPSLTAGELDERIVAAVTSFAQRWARTALAGEARAGE